MARSNRQYCKTYNDTLNRLQLGMRFANPTDLSTQLGVSRTTTRKISEMLVARDIVTDSPTGYALARGLNDADFYPKEETMSTEALIQKKLMTWVIEKNIRDGSAFSEAQFVREFGISHSSIREFLIRLSSYGFIRKEPNRQWVLQGMTKDYADEIYEFRKFFEFRSLKKIVDLPSSDPFWIDLETLCLKHEKALHTPITDPDQIKELDSAFHGRLNRAAGNRVFLGNDDAISLLFYYHYHLNLDQQQVAMRNERAIADHLRIIAALKARDIDRALHEMETHLDSAKSTLVSQLSSPALGNAKPE